MELDRSSTMQSEENSTRQSPQAAATKTGTRPPKPKPNKPPAERNGTDEDSMDDALSELESQLHEKELLVTALTQRLEQAAEQLDRYQRTGTGRGVTVGGGLPPELLEQQKELTEDLRRAVEQWETMQAAAALGRLEIQITELRDLVAHQGVSGSGAAGISIAPQGASAPKEASPRKPASGGGASSWEALKAELLGDEPPAPSQSPRESEAASAGQHTNDNPVSSQQAADTPRAAEIDLPPVDPPESIDVYSAGLEELQQAVLKRDDYIAYLGRRLANSAAMGALPANWAEFEHAPEELCRRLETLEKELEEKLRVAEVQLSIERARLGREESKLAMREEQIEKQMRKLGLQGEERQAPTTTMTPNEAPPTEEDPKGRRWMRFLSSGKGGDE
jgi:hypothetical protein